ncbi:unnamed protein product [Didymodactylos carnosus]|uniref:DUF302 domain-containing protein n=1 Tax=Didymodactylos carnosus TaxID=1234261 RepID=A0A814QS06_9BILA|nr:unnamed protein product [Didymodactylos carnosus]CAF3887350.1 unnamed protein product [Didymodactylos carnosus]
MTDISPSIQPYTAQRVTFNSARPFDDVVATLHKLLGSSKPIDYKSLASQATDIQSFEKIFNSVIGPSGFILFLEVDHGAWFSLFDKSTRKSRMFVLGNPLIARTMLEHNLTAGLHVPVRLLVLEQDPHITTISYDLPSSLIAIGGDNPALLNAAKGLDDKLEKLASQVANGK